MRASPVRAHDGTVTEQVRGPKTRNERASVCSGVATKLTHNRPFSAGTADGTSRARFGRRQIVRAYPCPSPGDN